jgi:predicted short-subunit dehydrogenase-like oxidoreductase (DUF2520 family)
LFQDRDIYIVGNGKAGSWLFHQLLLNGFIPNDNLLSARNPKLENFTSTKATFFIAVPDRYIESTARDYKLLLPDNCECWFVHLSGSKLSQSLASEINMLCGSFHPAFSIPSKMDSDLKITPTIAIEGDPIVCLWLKNLAEKLGYHPTEIIADKKNLYHAACVLAGSLNGLYYHRLCELFIKSGLTEDQSKIITKNLIISSIDNIDRFGVKDGLTGPIARGDKTTQDSNLDALSSNDSQMAELYTVLCKLSKDCILE